MRKMFLLLLPLFISGCPMGDKVNLHPAQATIVGKKVCVFVDKNEMVREEFILKVGIWMYGNDHYVYEKSYANTPVELEPGECVPGVDEYDFLPGEGYSVIVNTPLHPYEARFIVWERGEEVVLKSN
ncbi:putative T6SS immunity periplasmic lipoprotein [Serratia marcescens]|uniref:putative T6SS immunity periplasmic lipoprotein n=1 Tax=Serratia marcescens TaxID=615 RepID=UPI0013DAB823|nr:putative T6SS immunity periplasmic lipoprotein [Serratia marcescens]